MQLRRLFKVKFIHFLLCLDIQKPSGNYEELKSVVKEIKEKQTEMNEEMHKLDEIDTSTTKKVSE